MPDITVFWFAAMAAFSLTLVACWHLRHARWRQCFACLGAAVLPLVLFFVVEKSPFLDRALFYFSLNDTEYASGYADKASSINNLYT